MEDILDIAIEEGEGPDKARTIRLGIRVRFGDHESFCPVSGPIRSLHEWDTEIQGILSGIERLSNRGKGFFEPPKGEKDIDLSADLSTEELWSRLSRLEAEDYFIRTFNELESSRRREVADYVLTTCNVFSGKAALFSSLYDDDTGLLV